METNKEYNFIKDEIEQVQVYNRVTYYVHKTTKYNKMTNLMMINYQAFAYEN